jgi:transcriptional regulator with XRE-family HTH domain
LSRVRVNREALAAIRTAGGDSYDTLAERVGVTREALRLIENGITVNPRPRTLRKIAEALRVPLAAITLPDEDQERVS